MRVTGETDQRTEDFILTFELLGKSCKVFEAGNLVVGDKVYKIVMQRGSLGNRGWISGHFNFDLDQCSARKNFLILENEQCGQLLGIGTMNKQGKLQYQCGDLGGLENHDPRHGLIVDDTSGETGSRA